MVTTVFQLFKAPKVTTFIEQAARCVCRPRTCSDPNVGCDLGKPIGDAQKILGGLYPLLKSGGEEAILDPQEFLSSFIAAFFIFAQKSPFSIGKECTHFCESACTQTNLATGLGGNVQISSMERTLELLGSQIGKTEDNPFGLYKYLFQQPSAELIAENGGTKVSVIGTGPAAMQYAYRMRMNGFDVEMFEKESHERGGEQVPNFGGTWFNGVPYDKRGKEELMRYYYLLKDMGVKITVAEIGKDITVDELRAKSDIIFNGAGLVEQPMNLGLPNEKQLTNIEHAMGLLQPFNEAVNSHVVAGKDPKDFSILELAQKYSGQSVVIVGAGYTEKDCTEWFSKFNYALKEAGQPGINIIVLERQAKSIEGIRETHDGSWPKPAATLETHLAAIIQGEISGVDRKDAVVIDKIEQGSDGKLKLTLQIRKLAQASDILKDKGSRKYEAVSTLEVEADMVIKALGFQSTRDNPSRLDTALGSVETIQTKDRKSGELVDRQVVVVEDNRAKEPGVYYGGDNNTHDKGRASGHATLVAAFADGDKAAEASIRDVKQGLHKNPEAWQEERIASSVLLRTSYQRNIAEREVTSAAVAVA